MTPSKTFKVPLNAPARTRTRSISAQIDSSSRSEVRKGAKSMKVKSNKATDGQNKSNPEMVWKIPTVSKTSRPEGVSTTSSGSNEKPVQPTRKYKSPITQTKPLKESKPTTSPSQGPYDQIFAGAIGTPPLKLSQKSPLMEVFLRKKYVSTIDFESSDDEAGDGRATSTATGKPTSQGGLMEVANKGVKPRASGVHHYSMLFPGRQLDYDSRESDSMSEVESLSSTINSNVTPHLPHKRRVAEHRGNRIDKREKENQSDNVSTSSQASEQDTMGVKGPPGSPENSPKTPIVSNESLSQRSNVSPGPAPQRSARHSESQSLNQQSTPSTFEYSQPPAGLTKVATAEWLLDRRMNGTWVECVSCHKWRHLKNVHDPTSIPTKWVCSMNDDHMYNSCEKRQRRISLVEEAHMIFNKYSVGSLVWAYYDGCPWWPGIIDDDPEYEQFYWMDSDMSLEPDWYHVIFFDKPVTRAWVKENKLKPYTGNETGVQQTYSQPMVSKFIQKRLDEAKETIAIANGMDQLERIRKYGFLANCFLKCKGSSNINREEGVAAYAESSLSSVSAEEYISKGHTSEFSPDELA